MKRKGGGDKLEMKQDRQCKFNPSHLPPPFSRSHDATIKSYNSTKRSDFPALGHCKQNVGATINVFFSFFFFSFSFTNYFSRKVYPRVLKFWLICQNNDRMGGLETPPPPLPPPSPCTMLQLYEDYF